MTSLSLIEEKVRKAERINEDDALFLYNCPDLLAIGRLADLVNKRKNKSVAYYNVNRHINPTNICVMSCKFCAFARKPGEDGAYAYSREEIVQKAEEAVAQGATEIHMVGGLHPRWNLRHYQEMLSAIKERFPNLHIKGFTAVEIDWLARRSRNSVEEVLQELRQAGLGSLPGGGAEIFHTDIREEITAKLSTDDWLAIHRTAHKIGMHTNCTMLYGHVEHYEHRVYHLKRLRELQDETGGFNAFIPLSFQPHQNEMGIKRYTFGYDDLKNLAIARIYLDNFQHIKSYWIMMGQDIGQLGLHFGANDLDGTVTEEKISNMAGGRAGIAMSKSMIERLIYKADHLPVERNTVYEPLTPIPERDEDFAEYPRSAESYHDILAKVKDGHTLNCEDLLQLAHEGPLFDLGEAAVSLANKRFSHRPMASLSPSYDLVVKDCTDEKQLLNRLQELKQSSLSESGVEAATLTVDLAGLGKSDNHIYSLQQILAMAKALREENPEKSLTFLGIKGLWRTVQAEKMSLGEAFKYLSQAGVCNFESSRFEAESVLTNSEVVNLHAAAHEYDLATVVKIELSIPPNKGAPLWESFFRRLLALDELQQKTGGLIGVSIEAARDSLVTASEYCKAVALARLAAPHIPNVISSLLRIPSLSPSKGKGASHQYPEEKIAPLCLLMGANDLGYIPLHKVIVEAVVEEVRSAGYRPLFRDARFRHNQEGAREDEFPQLRHIPYLRS